MNRPSNELGACHAACLLGLILVFSGLVVRAQKPKDMPVETEPSLPAVAAPSPTPSDTTNEAMLKMAKPSPSPSPSSSPPMKAEMPGMNKPAASPSPAAASPAPEMKMPMPAASPSPMAGMDMNSDQMKMGPLIVLQDDEMGIRVGRSQQNIMWMGQMGSGTSWQPSTAPLYMHHWMKGDWLLMLHYNLIAGLNQQGGPRGVAKAESANWLMPMAYRKLGAGTLQLRGMFSAEPFTFPRGGSPQLFQTGETYKGRPVIDKQHPHDLFMELSAQYTVPLGERATWFTYFGYPGEPALGPGAFMHRASAGENPSATLAHHLQDSTHISFGVFTTGFTYRWFKLEGSLFNGREPDENRYDFDAHKWNSRSARVWFMPNHNWAMQVSYGLLRSPENQAPDLDTRRASASLEYNRPFSRGNWASAFIWGRNHVTGEGETHNLNGYTAESTVRFLDRNYFYTRLELVDKDDLLRAEDKLKLGIMANHPSFRIGAYTFGSTRDVWTNDKVSLALGGDVTFYTKPGILDLIYGDRPLSWRLFLRIRPAKMNVSSHAMHGSDNH